MQLWLTQRVWSRGMSGSFTWDVTWLWSNTKVTRAGNSDKNLRSLRSTSRIMSQSIWIEILWVVISSLYNDCHLMLLNPVFFYFFCRTRTDKHLISIVVGMMLYLCKFVYILCYDKKWLVSPKITITTLFLTGCERPISLPSSMGVILGMLYLCN